jgi:hypothetical protein
MLATLGRVSADDLVEHVLFVVQERQLALVELLEELVLGDFDQAFVLRLLRLREHDADNADVARLMNAIDGRRFAALALCPFADGLVVRGGLGHDTLYPFDWICENNGTGAERFRDTNGRGRSDGRPKQTWAQGRRSSLSTRPRLRPTAALDWNSRMAVVSGMQTHQERRTMPVKSVQDLLLNELRDMTLQVVDAALIAGAPKGEHYEIAA